MAYSVLGLKGYNRASYWQLSAMLKSLEATSNSLNTVSALTNGPIKIVDYGCSEGLNSTIFFYELIKKFRETSNKTIQILHNDIENNDWNVFFNTVNKNNPSYLNLANVYYSAIGKSFYNDIALPQSVHLGFSAHSSHYLSRTRPRKKGEKGYSHSGCIEQSKEDIENYIRKRIKELVPGGIFNGIIIGRSSTDNFHMYDHIFNGFLRLAELGYITQEEIENFEFSSCAIYIEDLKKILEIFSDKIETISLEIEKSENIFYSEYLKDKDIEKYANNFASFLTQIAKPNMQKFENKNLLEVYREEVRKMALHCLGNHYYEIIRLVFKKNN